MDCEIKELNLNQAETIKKVIEKAFSCEPWKDDWRDRKQFDMYVKDLIDHENSLSLGLYKDGALIAVCLGRVVHWHAGTQYRIDDLGIIPPFQGQGIGTHFIEQIEEICTKKGIKEITLKTNRRAGAYYFYQKNGFAELTDDAYFEKKCY